MKRIENRCVGCPPNLGCRGASCPNREVEVTICDQCGRETTDDEYWHTQFGEDICPDCWSEEDDLK